MTTRSRLIAAAITVSLFLTACGDGGGGTASPKSPTTTIAPSTSASDSTTTTTTAGASSTTEAPSVPVMIGTGERCADESSPAAVDETRGLYAAWVTSIDVELRTLGVDVIQWLVGDEADDAYHVDNPGDPGGVPNDYYIVNESMQVRTFDVADDVDVRVLSSGAVLIDGTFTDLPSALAARAPLDESDRLSYNPYWIAVNDGEITGICEQYTP